MRESTKGSTLRGQQKLWATPYTSRSGFERRGSIGELSQVPVFQWELEVDPAWDGWMTAGRGFQRGYIQIIPGLPRS